MKKYYYLKGERQFGPFDLEDLRAEGIERDTLIWLQGIKDWTKASEIADLGELFVHLPPPIPAMLTKEYRNSSLVLALACIIGCVLAWIEIYSIVVSGAVISIGSLVAFNFSKGEGKKERIISLIPLFVCLLCLLMILVGNLNPKDAIIPVGAMITIGTVFFVILSFDKLKRL